MTSSYGGAGPTVPSPGALPSGSPPVVNREDLPDRPAVLMVSGFTDWLDGKLARWLNQGSRLGALLDPAADRLYIVATLVALALREVIPVWLVALLVGRELVLGVMLLVLRHYGYPPLQVHYLGKAATFLLLYAFPGLMLADGTGWFATAIAPFAWAFTIWGTALYLLAGVFYVVQVAGIVQAERSAPAAGAVP